MKLLFATSNRGKVEEMRALIQDLPFELVTPEELGDEMSIDEDGRTFEQNARKKASEYLLRTGLYTLADDSGLEVDTLNGAPGVRSARFAGLRATDEQNNRKLLDEIGKMEVLHGRGSRHARFRCALALAFPGVGRVARVHVEEGFCDGEILDEPRGTGGFGYDPIFYVSSVGKTLAEMTLEEKNTISHRAQAMRKMAERMTGAVTGGGWFGLATRGTEE